MKRQQQNQPLLRTVLPVTLIFCFRMMGLFMILPIFAINAQSYTHSSIKLIGLALAIYGLTQACLQMPLAYLSDRYGRKRIIIGGLALFAIGSGIAASTHDLLWVIVGRALQGSGAIGSTCLALVADLTTIEDRTKAMAMIGASVGVSFAIAFILGPIINTAWGLSGIFWFTAFMAILGIIIVGAWIPTPINAKPHTNWQSLKHVLKSRQLHILNSGIFTIHAILTGLFTVLPIMLTQQIKLSSGHQWLFYLVVLTGAFICMIPLLIWSEKQQKVKMSLLASMLTLSAVLFYFAIVPQTIISLTIALLFFFAAFSLMEAFFPSLVSKIAPNDQKGAAMGCYSTAQFLGIFVGGALAGLIYHHYGQTTVMMFFAGLATLWSGLLLFLSSPMRLSKKIFKLGQINRQIADQLKIKLMTINGVLDARILPDHGIANLTVDHTILDKPALTEVMQNYARVETH